MVSTLVERLYGSTLPRRGKTRRDNRGVNDGRERIRDYSTSCN
jgi:hypothetical protein